MTDLKGKVALVAGATRGAGRGIAAMLGERGATVICTGRSVRGAPATGSRPETIEETAELVTRHGGQGVAIRTDHTDEAQVIALIERVKRDFGRLDVLVNDIWGGDELTDFGKPFWQLDMARSHLMFERGVLSHLITSRHAVPLMLAQQEGLIIEITDGDGFSYRGNVAYDLAKMSVIRLAFSMARDLRRHPRITTLALTPGFLRSEAMLDHFGVTEANWQDGAMIDPNFIASETPYFVGRAVAALAADPEIARKDGRVFSAWQLVHEYGFTDIDGRRPDWGAHFEQTYGRVPVADEEAYASWHNGLIERICTDWPIET